MKNNSVRNIKIYNINLCYKYIKYVKYYLSEFIKMVHNINFYNINLHYELF